MTTDINVIINLGSDQDRDTMKEHLTSKYGSVEVIDLTVRDGKLVDKQGDAHAREILSRIDARSKITISGQHSSLYGETFQMEANGRDGIPLTDRTRHYSDVVQFLGDRLKGDQFSSPSTPLSISIRSCYAGEGEEKSLAAKMQRTFAIAYNIHSTVTARRFLVYLGKPCYSVTLDEYRSIQNKSKKPEDFSRIGHQKDNSKMKFYWGPSGEQRVCDAYPYREKMKEKILNFCNRIDSNDPKLISILDTLKQSFESPETMGYIYDHLTELSENLPPKLKPMLNELLEYAKKHFDLIPKNKQIGSPVTEEERKNFKFIEQILDEKLIGVSNQAIKKLIKEHYLYNLKKQLNTDHLDKIIEDLAITPLQQDALERIERVLNDFVENTSQEPQIRLIGEENPVRASQECDITRTKRDTFRTKLLSELKRIAS